MVYLRFETVSTNSVIFQHDLRSAHLDIDRLMVYYFFVHKLANGLQSNIKFLGFLQAGPSLPSLPKEDRRVHCLQTGTLPAGGKMPTVSLA